MNKLEQKIIDENYEKLDAFDNMVIYKKGSHRICLVLGKEPIEYEFDRLDPSWERYLKGIYRRETYIFIENWNKKTF